MSVRYNNAFDDIRCVISSRQAKRTDRKHNATIISRQNTTRKTTDRAIRFQLKEGAEVKCSIKGDIACPTNITRRVSVKRQEHHVIQKSCTIV